MPSVTAKWFQYVQLKIICEDRSYLYFCYFFLTYISSATIGKFSVLNLLYWPQKTKNIFPFPLNLSFLTHEVPKYGLVVIFQYWNYPRSLFCPIIYGPPREFFWDISRLFAHFSLLSHSGGWQVSKRPLNALHSVFFWTSMAHLVKGAV